MANEARCRAQRETMRVDQPTDFAAWATVCALINCPSAGKGTQKRGEAWCLGAGSTSGPGK